MSDWTPSAVIEWEGDGLVALRPDWFAQAKCRGTDPDVFFPSDGMGVLVAQRICVECPVRLDCLEFALSTNQEDGVWGGESERSRRKIRRRRLNRSA